MAYPTPEKVEPRVYHAIVHGCIALGIVLFLASGYSWDLIARTVSQFLNTVGIQVNYVRPLYLMYVRLLDGTVVGFQVLIECSGIIMVAVFALISIFTIGLLRGSVWVKVGWLLLSVGVGLTWNVSRLALVVAVAYNFGLGAFSLVHYVLAPFVDFLWIVGMWSLGMSWLKGGEAS